MNTQQNVPLEENSLASEHRAFIHVVRSVFVAAYAQGQFDLANGFNSSTSLEDVATEWMEDHHAVFKAPVELNRLIEQLANEAKKDRSLTNT